MTSGSPVKAEKKQLAPMKRMFRKGDLVRDAEGKVMEVLQYPKAGLVEVWWFDQYAKEVRKDVIRETRLSKAA